MFNIKYFYCALCTRKMGKKGGGKAKFWGNREGVRREKAKRVLEREKE